MITERIRGSLKKLGFNNWPWVIGEQEEGKIEQISEESGLWLFPPPNVSRYGAESLLA
jgi:hypothetical protein